MRNLFHRPGVQVHPLHPLATPMAIRPERLSVPCNPPRTNNTMESFHSILRLVDA